jgi:ATPase subunit of ABC transporter with duplicated ATPase domains
MLYKAVAIILSTLLIAAVQISTANAGGCHRGGGGFHAYQASLQHSYALKQQRARQAAQAKAQARAVAAAKQRKSLAVQQARAEKAAEAKAEKVAAVDTALVKDEPAEVATGKDGPENELAVASVEQTCTRFIAEIGKTVPVDCTKQ